MVKTKKHNLDSNKLKKNVISTGDVKLSETSKGEDSFCMKEISPFPRKTIFHTGL
jgi:hypothetical protein